MPFGLFGSFSSGVDVTPLRQAAFVSSADEDDRCRPQTITKQYSGDDSSTRVDSSVTTDTGTCASDLSSPSSID
jgi:hypothetical protein